VPADKVQVVLLNDPVEFVAKVTVPVGVTAPVPEASETVAVQVVATLSKTLAGEHVTLVEDALIVEVTVKAVLVLPEWTLLPP
jgi:hypothetical protein